MRRTTRADRSFLPAPQRLRELTDVNASTLEALREGTLEIIGRLADASNATFLCHVANHRDRQGDPVQAVYKPVRGERPLDDFPRGTLSNREVAAFVLSEASGWSVVPPSVMRDGPLGPGLVQLWIDVDPDVDILSIVVERDPRLRRICVLDIVANNADRKGGHLLPTPSGHVYGVDHGICFAVAPKLRTVLWGWRGERLLPDELDVVRQLCDALDGELGRALAELLDADEVRATQARAEALLRTARFPQPDPSRPALPWPPF